VVYLFQFKDYDQRPILLKGESPQDAIINLIDYLGMSDEVANKAIGRTESVDECVKLYNLLAKDRDYAIQMFRSTELLWPAEY